MDNRIATENPGVLFIQAPGLNEQQVSSIMNRMFSVSNKILKTKKSPGFRVNTVRVKDAPPIYSYVFVEDQRVVNIMQSLNPDGTKRLEKRLNKNCKYVKNTLQVNTKEKNKRIAELYLRFFGNTEGINHKSKYFGNYYDENGKNLGAGHLWSDFQEQEDDINGDYEPKYDIVKLDSLWKTYRDKEYNVDVLPSKPKAQDTSVNQTILEAYHVDKSVTNEAIRNVFSKYNTKQRYKLVEGSNMDIERVYYPIVTRHETPYHGSVVRVAFDPESNDARYAIHMERHITIAGKQLVFNFPKFYE